MKFLVLLAVLVKCYLCSPLPQNCGGGLMQYSSPCQQARMQCPPNTAYSNGVCVGQQYQVVQQPITNFMQAPTSCGSNMVLYNGGCQSQSVATCPYTSTLQNGICTRNQFPQYAQAFPQMSQAVTLPLPMPQQMQIPQPLPQPMPQQIQIPQPLPQPIPQQMQIAQPLPQPMPQQMQIAQPLPQPFQMMRTQPNTQSFQMLRSMPLTSGCQTGTCNG